MPPLNSVNPDDNVPQDEAWLRDYVTAKSSRAEDKEKLAITLAEIGGADNPDASEQIEPTQLSSLKKRQDTTDRTGITTDRGNARTEIAQAQINEELRRQNASRLDKVKMQATDQLVSPLQQKVQDGLTFISNAPTGSVAFLVIIIIGLLFLIVNVDGKGTTRLKQLWYMLMGRATLNGRVSLTGGSSSSSTQVQGNNGIGIDNGSSTGQGNGTLPAAGKGTIKVNLDKFQKDQNKLNTDLLIGNINGDIVDQWGGLSANNQLQIDVVNKAAPNIIKNDLNTLQASLNKLNDPLYNTDYTSIYRDLGL